MGRIFLKNDGRKEYFKRIKKRSKLTWSDLAKKLGYSKRNLFDWRLGKYSLPQKVVLQIEKLYNVIPQVANKKPEYWYTHKAGKLGAITRNEIYGNPGSSEGRRKGGRNSQITHKLKGTKFVTRKEISIPEKSLGLSEFIGVVLGDGSISEYQVTIYLNLTDDADYVAKLTKLIKELFNINVSFYVRKKKNIKALILSSKALVEFLVNNNELTIGNKIKNNIQMPSWIKSNKYWQAACIKGLFDTDGCVFLDKHKINGKIYKNLGLVFSSSSPLLLKDIKSGLIANGYSPTDKHGGDKLMMRREDEIINFFGKIKPRNPKHVNRFRQFLQERYRSGHNGTASKAVRD